MGCYDIDGENMVSDISHPFHNTWHVMLVRERFTLLLTKLAGSAVRGEQGKNGKRLALHANGRVKGYYRGQVGTIISIFHHLVHCQRICHCHCCNSILPTSLVAVD